MKLSYPYTLSTMFTAMFRWPLALFLCAIVVQVQCENLHTIRYSSHVYHENNTYRYFQEPLNIPPSNKIIVNYHVSYDTRKCCPVLGFQRLTGAHARRNTENKEFYDECIPDGIKEVSLYNSVFIIAQPGFNDECRYEGPKTVCNGTRTLTSVSPVRWVFDAGYECQREENLDLNVEADVKYTTNSTSTCEPMELLYCRDRFGYNATAFSNAIGQESQREANKLFLLWERAFLQLESVKSCYQHSDLITCYTFFPPCQNNKRIFPCKFMCDEWKAGCARHYLPQIVHHFQCDALPASLDPDVCFYQAVECPTLQHPKFGSVVVEGLMLGNISRYQCNDTYELRGESVLECEPSGYWNSSAPTCELPSSGRYPPTLPIYKTADVLIASVVTGVIIIIIIIFCIMYRDTIKVFIIYNKHNPFARRIQERKTLFIAYSSLDRDEVSLDFVPQVREQLHGWSVKTYQDDFIAGQPILDCIREGVWESQAVLVLLTENFMTSSWCLHEFIEAETRSALDDGFKLIVIMFIKDNQGLSVELLEGLPDSLKRYIQTRVYIGLWEPLLWNKLRRALKV